MWTSCSTPCCASSKRRCGRSAGPGIEMVNQRQPLTTSSSIFGTICATVEWCRHDVLDAMLEIAIEIAREGREGRRIGTLFTLGNADAVLASSRALILDPLAGHAPAATHITDPNLRGTVKELAQLDGAFVVN